MKKSESFGSIGIVKLITIQSQIGKVFDFNIPRNFTVVWIEGTRRMEKRMGIIFYSFGYIYEGKWKENRRMEGTVNPFVPLFSFLPLSGGLRGKIKVFDESLSFLFLFLSRQDIFFSFPSLAIQKTIN